MNLNIGSGDIHALMSGVHTKTYQDLLRKFVDENKPYYNALASPIDALRTGAILEARYLLLLTDDYFIQYKSTCEKMDVFTSSIDFAQINNGIMVDFDELKTIHLTDFIDIIQPLIGIDTDISSGILKKTFKKYYNQIQCQLMCSGLESANLVFLAVTSYDDDVNYFRNIQPNEYAKFRITRDDKAISEIERKGEFFQNIKNHFKNN